MTVWHWVRHGPTHARSFVGWRDVPADLSDAERISRLKSHLPAEALLVSSDLIRASATADIIAAPGHHRLADDPDLREFDFGDWDGLPFAEVAERDPELSRAYWETPGEIAPPGGESWNAAAARVNTVVDRLNALHPTAEIIAVAHIGVIMTQIGRARSIPPAEAISHEIDNLSVTQVGWRDGHPDLQRINFCP